MLNLRWESEARRQLDETVYYIGQRDGAAAARLEEALGRSAERLTLTPFIGRPGRIAGTREWIVHPNYLLIYRISETTIDVIRVLHARQRYP